MTTHYGSTYEGADEFLHTRGRKVVRKKVGNNTYLVRHGDTIALQLHATYVVIYEPDKIRLETGGWLTVTTKDRINHGLPSGWSITSEKGTWYLREGGWSNARTVVRYTDGITLIRERGTWQVDPRTTLPYEDQHREDRHNAAMRKLITKYLKGLTPDVLAKAWSTTAGDCILCRIGDTEDVGRGEDRPRYVSIGDKMGDTQHLIEHMVEGYYVGHLFMSALSEAGYIAHTSHSVETTKRVTRAYLARRLYVGATTTHNGRRPVTAA